MTGSIRRRSEGTWEITIELPRGIDKKRRRELFTFRGRKKDAEAELTARLIQLAGGASVDAQRTPLRNIP